MQSHIFYVIFFNPTKTYSVQPEYWETDSLAWQKTIIPLLQSNTTEKAMAPSGESRLPHMPGCNKVPKPVPE